jgi:hypothetical protein
LFEPLTEGYAPPPPLTGIYTTAASADRWICAVVAAAAAILTE